MQETFWLIKEAIDTYFVERAFETTVVAGCFRGKKTASTEIQEEAEPEPSAPREESQPKSSASDDERLSEDFLLDDDSQS